MKLIIGLGNPGKKYERTRHNAGWLFIDRLAGDAPFKAETKNQAAVLKTTLNGRRVLLAKPLTFMNNSGSAVALLLHFYKLTPNALIVVHDDKDIPLGEFRIQTNRGAGGHNGVLSIIEHLGTKDFTRVRLGVAPTEKTIHDTADFVLGKLTAGEQTALRAVFDNVRQEIETLVGA